MIDTSTAEILASVQGHGEESRSGAGILGAGGSSSGWGGGALDMKSSNFANTILGAAVNKATSDVAHGLDQKAASLPTAPVKVVKIAGLVADVSPDGTIIINVGSKDGVKVGDKLAVNRKVREVKDPATGKVSAASSMPWAPSTSPKWTSPPRSASSPAPLRPKSATPSPSK